MLCLMLSDNLAAITTYAPKETKSLGAALGSFCYPGLAILLHGALGMGKTLLTSGIGSALGYDRIKSPSFIIVSEHTGGSIPLAHADLYRLESQLETDDLDLESYIDAGYLLVVEWAEHWDSAPREDRWDVTIGLAESEANEDIREISISAAGKRASRALRLAISGMISNDGSGR